MELVRRDPRPPKNPHVSGRELALGCFAFLVSFIVVVVAVFLRSSFMSLADLSDRVKERGREAIIKRRRAGDI